MGCLYVLSLIRAADESCTALIADAACRLFPYSCSGYPHLNLTTCDLLRRLRDAFSFRHAHSMLTACSQHAHSMLSPPVVIACNNRVHNELRRPCSQTGKSSLLPREPFGRFGALTWTRRSHGTM
jgi:hypothetical protein